MINKRTVLILGAGASVPYGFPTGEELMKNILDLYDRTKLRQGIPDSGDYEIITKYLLKNYELRLIKDFFENLRTSGKYSVDAFIEHRRIFTEIGKALISYEIIKCEREDRLSPVEGNWYKYLYNRINDSYDEIPENNLSILTFNYDRSFEQCMLKYVQSDYGKTFQQAESILSSIPIIHLHGKLGELSPSDKENYKSYSQEFSMKYINTCIRNIKIIHEDVPKDDVQFNAAIDLISKADIIWFLGFGFHKANLRRLRIPEILPSGKEILATTLGKEIGELYEIYNSLKGRLKLDWVLNKNHLDVLSYLRVFSNHLN